MAVHVDNVKDLAKTNEGVAVILNRYTDWKCKSGVTEAPLLPSNLGTRITDYAKTTLKGDSVALNFSDLVLSLGATVSVGTPGSVLVELINPNMDGPFQLVQGQSLSWSPGSGRPCLMIFSIHHQLTADAEPFRIRISNNGIPTKKTFARCHAYWGFDLSTRMRYYKNEPAKRIDLDVGFYKTHLSNMKQVRDYVQYTFDNSRMDGNPQLVAKSTMNVVPRIANVPKYVGIAPPSSSGNHQEATPDDWLKQYVDKDSKTNKLSDVESSSDSSSLLSMRARSRRYTKNYKIPIKRHPQATGEVGTT
nr:movement protein [Carnation ringspot virus]